MQARFKDIITHTCTVHTQSTTKAMQLGALPCSLPRCCCSLLPRAVVLLLLKHCCNLLIHLFIIIDDE